MGTGELPGSLYGLTQAPLPLTGQHRLPCGELVFLSV